MELLIMIDAFKRASAGRITAVVPYYAYGRSDKKDQPRVPITARLVADMISVAGADRVLTMDLHQGQIQGFFNIPVDELTAVHLLSNYFRHKQIEDLVVVTDLGFAKRARTFAELLDAPLAIIEKRRIGNLDRAELLLDGGALGGIHVAAGREENVHDVPRRKAQEDEDHQRHPEQRQRRDAEALEEIGLHPGRATCLATRPACGRSCRCCRGGPGSSRTARP